jgi:signal transduction histidine kinase
VNLARIAPFFAALLLAARAAAASGLEIEQVLSDGEPVAFSHSGGVTLPAGRHDLEIRFRTQGETPWGWIVHHRLEGHDPAWRTVDGEMAMIARLLDGAGRELASLRAPVPAQPLGWTGSMRRSELKRHLEPIVVPAGAKSLEIAFDSGTSRPEVIGEWLIADVTVNRADQTFGPKESLWLNPTLAPADPQAKDNFPVHWERRGNAAIARLEKSRDPKDPNYLLRIRDLSKESAGAWVSRQPLPPEVKPGEVLTIGWWERSRVETQRPHTARYEDVPPGRMLFRAVARGAAAVYDAEVTLPIVIRPYLWTEPWFTPVVVLLSGSVLAVSLWQWQQRRYRQRLARFELEARIEKDRARIARDMHDELGASLTRIALMSDLAAIEPAGDGAAAGRFGEIAKAARSVSGTLDQIVWTVNPRNDTVERLVGYLGEFATEYLESAGIPLTLDLPLGPPATPVASDVRHQVLLGVKEALNNIAKYAGASTVTFRVAYEGGDLRIVIADDGCGFDPAAVSPYSNGLRHMQQRFAALGGSAQIESHPGGGTTVRFHVPLGRAVSSEHAT